MTLMIPITKKEMIIIYMTEVLANTTRETVWPYITNQHAISLKLLLYVKYISIKIKNLKIKMNKHRKAVEMM